VWKGREKGETRKASLVTFLWDGRGESFGIEDATKASSPGVVRKLQPTRCHKRVVDCAPACGERAPYGGVRVRVGDMRRGLCDAGKGLSETGKS